MRYIALIPAFVYAIGCGQIDPPPPLDEDGEPVPIPEPLDDWLNFLEIVPEEELSVRPTITIAFNAYLDPTTYDSYSTARLQSGGLRHGSRVDYRMTRREIHFRPTSDLEPELQYELVWTADDVRSVTGSPLHPRASLPTFMIRDDLETSPPLQRPEVSWREVEELFEAHCTSCHGDSRWSQLPMLTPETLIGARSDQVDAMLVEPFHPARSYLMHKILPDYPVRRFTEQPPPWSDQPPLSTDDIERIEHWIANGAPHP